MKPSGLLRKSVVPKVGADARAFGESRAPVPQFVTRYAAGADRGQPGEPADLTLSLLFRTTQRLQTALDRCFLTLGTTAQEAAVLLCCANADGISARGLAEALDKDKGRITRYVDRLVARRLVTRKIHPRNRSVLVIASTSRGRQLAPQLKRKFEEIRSQLFADIAVKDMARLQVILSQLLTGARRMAAREDGTAAANRLEAKSMANEDGVAANR
jgi:DNA-binding MarR family transcriptional regulator